MASSLNVIGNHRMKFDNPKSIIKEVEKLLGIQIMDGTYKTLSNKIKTAKCEEAKFYTSFNHLDHNFENWNLVKIISNYTPCYELSIYRKTILLLTNISVKPWSDILSEEVIEEHLHPQQQHTVYNWKKIKAFSKMITGKLNGNQLLFLSDNYENISDMCSLGEANIQEMIEVLANKFSAKQLNSLKETELKNRLRFNWLNMKLDKGEKWILDPNETLKNAI